MAILQFRRGTAFIDPQEGEPFLDTDSNLLKVGISGSQFITLLTTGSLSDGISGSISPIENRLDNIEIATQSFETKFDDLSPTTASILTRLDLLEGGSGSVNASVAQLQLFTQSVETAITFDSTNVTINGNLNVQGTTTTIDSTTVQIGDNIIELNGSSASNGGLLVKDVTNPSLISGSLLWDSTNDYWKAGKLGSESEIITISNIVSNLPPDVVSGSSQVDVTQTTNYSSINQYSDVKVKTKLDAEGVISSSAQITITESQISDLSHYTDSDTQTYIDSIGLVSGSITNQLPSGVVSGSSQVEFNDVSNNPFSQSLNSVTVSKSIIPTSNNIDLGTSDKPFKDLYLSSASLYIDGTQVISSTEIELTLSTDTNQSLKILETGVDTIQIQSENGDITLVATGNGNIELDAPIQIVAGNKILSSDGNPIVFGEDIDIEGNITVDGTVDGVDVSTLKNNFDTLNGKTLVSGSSQIILNLTDSSSFSTTNVIEGDNLYYTDTRVQDYIDAIGVITGSSQITITESQISDFGSYVPTNSNQSLSSNTNALTLSGNNLTLTRGDGSTDVIDLSAYLDEDARAIASGTLNGTTGIVTFTRDDSTTFELDLSDLLDDTNLVTSVNGKAGVVVLTTDNVSEGSGSFYYTDERVKTKLDTEGVISSSAQITITESQITDLDHYTDSDTQAYIDSIGLVSGSITGQLPPGVVSGSSQIDVTQTTNYSSINQYSDVKVKTKLDTEGVISGSSQITITESQITDLDHYTDSDTQAYIDSIGLVSGSITGQLPSGVVSGSSQVDHNQTTNYSSDEHFTQANITTLGTVTTGNVDAILPNGVISGSDQITITESQISDLNHYTDSDTLSYINSINVLSGSVQSQLPNGVISGSEQITITESQISDLNHYTDSDTLIYINSVGVVSGSSQIDVTQTTNYSSINQYSDVKVKTKLNVDGVISGSSQITITESQISDLSHYTDSDTQAYIDSIGLVSGSIDDQLPSGVVSGSSQIDVTQTTNYDSVVNVTDDQTIGGVKTFDDIIVNGTGSFAYIESVTGSAKIIGDAFIVLNNDTPTERYAGIKVLDSGSSNTTASLQYDGETNDWFYEYDKDETDYGVIIFGPEYSTKGNPTYLSNNTIPKSTGGHHIVDSNITDSGTLITLGSDTQVDGTLTVTTLNAGNGIISSSAQITITESQISDLSHYTDSDTQTYIDSIGLVSGSSQVDVTQTTNYSSINQYSDAKVKTKLDAEGVISGSSQITITESQISDLDHYTDSDTLNYINSVGVISGSSQISLGGDVTGTSDSTTVGAIQGVSITSTEANQLANIGSTTISTDQWGYVGNLNQNLRTTDNVTHRTLTLGDNSSNNGSLTLWESSSPDTSTLGVENNLGISQFTMDSTLKVTGDILATGDVVAYSTSDKRFKDNLTQINSPIEKISQLNGYSFEWNEDKQYIYKGKDYGVVAQEVQEILPELVQTRENGFLAVNYEKLVPLLIESIKELNQKVIDLNKKLENN